jgi:hypothetical protein
MMEEKEPNLFWIVAKMTRRTVRAINAMTTPRPMRWPTETGGATFERLKRVGAGTGAVSVCGRL